MSFDLKIANGDIVISRNGDLETVFDNAKLRQDIIKILLTDVGENKFHPNYGSKVGSLDVGIAVDQELVESDIEASVEDAIRYIMRLQSMQQKSQYLTPGEVIAGINNIRTERDRLDPRMFNVFVSVFTKKLTVITETIPVRII